MPEQKSRFSASEVAVKATGGRALFGAAMAIVGALAAVNPAHALLAALSEPPKMTRRK